MAKVGFRRELLGFNREDVIDFIKKMQKSNSEKETEFADSIDKLNQRNAELIDELKRIPELEAEISLNEATIAKLSKETAELRAKQLEVKKIGEEIAKMYLVAKSNADAINQSTKESSELAFYEIQRTLRALEDMQNKLFSIKADVTEASQKYSRDLDNITQAFENAKDTIDSISAKVSEVTDKH